MPKIILFNHTKMSYRILRGFTAVSVIGILIWFCILVGFTMIGFSKILLNLQLAATENHTRHEKNRRASAFHAKNKIQDV